MALYLLYYTTDGKKLLKQPSANERAHKIGVKLANCAISVNAATLNRFSPENDFSSILSTTNMYLIWFNVGLVANRDNKIFIAVEYVYNIWIFLFDITANTGSGISKHA